MKKTRWKRWISLLLVLTMVLVPTFSAQAKSSSCHINPVYDDDGNRTGFQSVIIDDMEYYDIDGGAKENRTSAASQLNFLKRVLQSADGSDEDKSLLRNWSDLAYELYDANSIYCAQNFDNAYGLNDGFIPLAALLAGDSNETGNNYDKSCYVTATGLQTAASLNDVRNRVFEEASSTVGDSLLYNEISVINSVTAEWLDENIYEGDSLSYLKDDSSDIVLYSLVSVANLDNEAGVSCDLDVFGLAFYDFKLQVIANDDLSYITAAEGYSSVEDASNHHASGVTYSSGQNGDQVLTYYQNGSVVDADIGVEFTQSDSMEVSNEFSETKNYTYTEMIGSETSLGLSLGTLFGGSTNKTMKEEFTTQEALATGYTDTTSVTKETSSTISTNMSLAPQTAVGIESSTSTTDVSLDYDCPIAITYKVAVFGTSAYLNYYTSGSFGRADVATEFCTLFGSDNSIAGTDAVTNLYNRAILYADSGSFDGTFSQTYMRQSGYDLSDRTRDYIDWSNISSGATGDTTRTKVPITLERYEAEVQDEGTVQEGGAIDDFEWGYGYSGYETNVNTVTSFTDTDTGETYSLYTDEVCDESGNDLNGDLKQNSSGTWYKTVSPAEGEETCTVRFYYTKDDKGDASPTNITPYAEESGDSELTEYAEIEAVDSAATIQWLTTHTPMSITGGTISTSERSMTSEMYGVEPIYPLNATKVVSDQKIFDMLSGDTLNLDNIEVDGYNANNVPYFGFDEELGYWILTDEDGNEITDSRIASLETNERTGITLLTAGEEEGTVYLEYRIDEDATNYTYMDSTTKATNSSLSSLATVQVNVTNQPFTGTVTASGSLTAYVGEPVNLDDCKELTATVWDKTGVKIQDAYVTWQSQLGEPDGIILVDNNLSFTEAGEYLIRATYGQGGTTAYSDWVTVTVLPEKALNEIVIADETDPATLEPFILGDDSNQVCLDNLTLAAYDQYGFDWDQLENLTWYVDDEEIEPTGGLLIYTATEAGDHTIYAECDGVVSNALTLTVLDERALSEIVIADESDPAVLEPFILNDGNNEVNLDNLAITMTDQYGDNWASTEDLKWYVDDELVEPTKGSAIYTATASGEHTIYAEYDGAVSNTLTLTVLLERSKSDGITLNESSMLIKVSDNAAITATLSPDYSEDGITWTSSDPKVASVDQNGTVTAVSVGNATITATTGTGLSAQCEVKVVLHEDNTYAKGNYLYKVTSDKTNGKGTVEIKGFSKSHNKKKVKIPATMTCNGISYKVTSIADRAFIGNKKITSVNTGENVTKIGIGAFRDCKNLKKVVIGDKTEKIGKDAFFHDGKMTKLTIGKNVTTIGAHAFCEDKNLKTITINSKKLTKVGSPHAFIQVGKATVKVPASKLKSYKKLLSKRGLDKAVFKKK